MNKVMEMKTTLFTRALEGIQWKPYSIGYSVNTKEDVMNSFPSNQTSVGAPKDKSSIELKLRWGTFCKSVAQEPDTRETTIIGVLPALQIAIQAPPGSDKKATFNLPMPVWVHIGLVTKSSNTALVKVEVEVDISINNQNIKQNFPLEVLPGEAAAMINMRVQTPMGIPLHDGAQKLVVALAYQGNKLGEVELPIKVDVVTMNQVKQVKP